MVAGFQATSSRPKWLKLRRCRTLKKLKKPLASEILVARDWQELAEFLQGPFLIPLGVATDNSRRFAGRKQQKGEYSVP
jgi:hypothetical protein